MTQVVGHPAAKAPGARGAYASELLKLTTLQFPLIIVVVGAVLCTVAGMVVGISTPTFVPTMNGEEVVVRQLELAINLGLLSIEIVAVTVGAFSVTTDLNDAYAQTALLAVPRRWLVLVTKMSIGAVYAGCAGIVLSAATLGAVLPLIGGRGFVISPVLLPPALGTVGLCAVAAALLCCLSIGLAALTRSSVAGVLLPLAIVFIAPLFAALIAPLAPGVASWMHALLPSFAATRLLGATTHIGAAASASAWLGLVVLVGWVLVAGIAALVVLGRRDFTSVPRESSANHSTKRGVGRDSAAVAFSGAGLFSGLAASEALKLVTLRSVRWLIACGFVALTGLAILRAVSVHPVDVGGSLLNGTAIETVYQVTAGVPTAELIFAIVAIIAVGSEYGIGRPVVGSVLAIPRRGRLLAAKVAIALGVVALVSLLGLVLAQLLSAQFRAASGFLFEWFPVSAEWAVARGTVCLVLTAALALGIAGVTRNSAVSIVVIALLFVVLPAMFDVILALTKGTSWVWIGNITFLLPQSSQLFYTAAPTSLTNGAIAGDSGGALNIGPWGSLAVLATWALVSLGAWFVRFAHRDV